MVQFLSISWMRIVQYLRSSSYWFYLLVSYLSISDSFRKKSSPGYHSNSLGSSSDYFCDHQGSPTLFSCYVVSGSLRPSELQHTRLPCRSLSPWVCSHSTSIESMMPSSHLIHCRLLPLPSIFPTIKVFSNTSAFQIRWPDYSSGSFSISPPSEYSGWISFRMDWFDLLAVQGTFKCLLQHHSLKASILQHSAFFMVQLSHPYMTTGRTMPLTIGTCVGKVMSLLFNTLSRLVIIAFLPRNKHLLIPWL